MPEAAPVTSADLPSSIPGWSCHIPMLPVMRQGQGRMPQRQVGGRDEAAHGQEGMQLVGHMDMGDAHPVLLQPPRIGDALSTSGSKPAVMT